MLYLVLSIVFNTLLFVIVKIFKRYEIRLIHAIIANYLTASTLGFMRLDSLPLFTEIAERPWFWWSVALGLNFILVFNLLALTTQKGGVSIASVITKMSLVIPVIFAFFYFDDRLTFLKIAGILLALLAVYFTSKKQSGKTMDKRFIFLPLLLFVGSGILDTLLKFISHNYVADTEMDLFSAFTFLMAGSYGLVLIVYQIITKKFNLKAKSIIAGICLGIPNYFSLYFLIMALDSNGLESSVVFPLNNVGIVLLSAVTGLIAFKETLSFRNWMGIAFAVLAIMLITFS